MLQHKGQQVGCSPGHSAGLGVLERCVRAVCAGSRALKEEKTGKQGFTAATPATAEQSITANGTSPVL